MKVPYENRELAEKLKEKEKLVWEDGKLLLFSFILTTNYFHEFIMFLVVRCILRSLFHLEMLLQELTLAFLMSGVSMAGRISLLGWILQINIVEMF